MRARRRADGARVASLLGALIVLASCSGGGSGALARSHSTTSATTATTTSPSTISGHGVGLRVEPAPWELPQPSAREVALVSGGDIVALGGIDGSNTSTGAVWRIDPSSGKAARAGDLDPAVHDAAGVRHGDDFWVIAGGTPPVRSAVQSVRIGATTRTLGHLPQARADHVAAVVRNTTFVLGGGDEASTLVADVVASDDGVTWRSAGVLAEPVRYPAVALVGDAIYLFGGVSTKSGVDTGSIQRYDTTAQRTTVIGHLPSHLSHASAVVLDGQIYLLGGYVNDRELSAHVLAYDPASGAVTMAGSLPGPRSDAAAVVVGDTGYLLGGEGPDRKAITSVLAVRRNT